MRRELSKPLDFSAVSLETVVLPEGKRMASGFIGNEVPRMGLRVRISCPPL